MDFDQTWYILRPKENLKPDTYLDLKKIWNPIDFQGQRSQSLIFRRGDTPRFALPLLHLILTISVDIAEYNID